MRAARLIARWCELYTRGLEPAVAAARRDELASDLFEHAASDPKAGAAMLSRAIRGVPADLAWRYEQRRAAQPKLPLATRVLSGGVATLTAAAAAALIGLGVFAIWRRVFGLARRVSLSFDPPSDNGAWIVGLTLLAAVGAALLLRDRTRALGALTLAASTLLIYFVHLDFSAQSVTVAELAGVPEWGVALWSLIGCLACLFLSAAVLWLPRRRETP